MIPINNSKILVITYIALLLAFFFLGSLLGNELFMGMQTLKSDVHTCEGINIFYSNVSFWTDESIMHKVYENCYNNNNNLMYEVVNLYEPIDLLSCENKSIDCEDYAHMVRCLAQKYDIKCRFYIETRSFSVGHAGTECFIDNEWFEVS